MIASMSQSHDIDPELMYAQRALKRIRSGELHTVPWEQVKRDRKPRDRRAALGGLAHGILCTREWCDASGGSSSVAYEAGHRDWVERIDEVVAELEREDVGLRTPEFHALMLRAGSAASDIVLTGNAAVLILAGALHRAWCANAALSPDGCTDPGSDVCRAAFTAASQLISQLDITGLELVDLRRAHLVERAA